MPTFKVDGVEYPTLEDDLTLDEAGWFFRISGIGIEQIAEPGVASQPLVVKALICLSIARARPDATPAEIEERIGKLKLTELEQVFEGMDDGGQSPPVESTPSESDEKDASSGAPSSGASDPSLAVDDLVPTGPLASDTSSDSDRETSVGLRRIS